MENIKLNKEIYTSKETLEELNNKFNEFKLKPTTQKEFFANYDSLFYEIPKNGRLSHNTIVTKSTKYAGEPPNPKIREIADLEKQIDQIQRNIDSIEQHHDLLPNRSVIQNRNNPELKYYMQSGRKRPINKESVFKLIKNQQGARKMKNSEFVVLLDQSAIDGILEGLPINTEEDLNVSILEINRNALENIG